MTKETFIWHPDEDDVYDGNLFGDTFIENRPCSAFRKGIGKSFTMNGDGHTLTLAPIPQDIDVFIEWGATPGPWLPDPAVTQITINSGTLQVMSGELDPTADAVLGLGVEDAVVVVDVTGNFIVRDVNVEGAVRPSNGGPMPGTTINVHRGGQFLVGSESLTRVTGFTGAFDINVHDMGSVSVTAHIVRLTGGAYSIGDASTTENSSFEIIALPTPSSQGSPLSGDGSLSASSHHISCRSASTSLLRAISMSYTGAHIKVEDSASLSIACDSIAFDGAVAHDSPIVLESGTIFAVGQGAAVITFAGSSDGPAPFDFQKMAKQYPKGLFNFITNEDVNKSKFRFLGIGSAFDFFAMVQEGLIAVNGSPDDGTRTTWSREPDPNDPGKYYFTIYLK